MLKKPLVTGLILFSLIFVSISTAAGLRLYDAALASEMEDELCFGSWGDELLYYSVEGYDLALPDDLSNLYLLYPPVDAAALGSQIEVYGELPGGGLVCRMTERDILTLPDPQIEFRLLQPMTPLRIAAPTGAMGLINADAIVDQVDVTTIESYDFDLTEFQTRYAYASQNNDARDYIIAELTRNNFDVIVETWLGAIPASMASAGDLLLMGVGRPYLFISKDGGDSFSTYHATEPDEEADINDCAILSTQNLCFAVGRHFYLSTDGGDNWNSQQLYTEEEITALSFYDAQHGYLFTDDGNGSYTTDGGVNWTPLTALDYTINTCHATDSWVVAAGSRGRIYRSTDAGQSWEQVYSAGDNHIIRQLAFEDDSNGMAVGAGVVLITDDGGATWTHRINPSSSDSAMLNNVTSFGYEAGCYSVGGYKVGVIAITTDSGQSWTEQRVGQAAFVSAQSGSDNRLWIASADGPAFSADDGSSFTWRMDRLDKSLPIVWENVIGEKQGSTEPRSYVYATAHFDSIAIGGDSYTYAPGANDNGTGTSTLLELSRVFASYTPQKTLRLFFNNAEELGLVGSGHHAGKCGYEDLNILGVMNIDMDVWSDPPDVQEDIDIVYNDSSEWLARLFAESCQRYGDGLPTLMLHQNDFYRSDHAPFWEAGYAAFLAIEDLHVPYGYQNTEDDEYWRIQGHFGLTRQVTRAVAGALASMAGITDESLYDLSAAYAYPSPWNAAEHDAITFNGLAPGATLSVFDTAGTLVFSTTVSGYEYEWSVANGSGKPVASGVYLFTATTTDGAIVRGKLAIIR